MKTIHNFKGDFKHYKLLKKEWLGLDEIGKIEGEVSFISFRYVNEFNKIVNPTKTQLLEYLGLKNDDIIKEVILDDEFAVKDGFFIESTVKVEGKGAEERVGDQNFFFLRDVFQLVNKYYYNGNLSKESEKEL